MKLFSIACAYLDLVAASNFGLHAGLPDGFSEQPTGNDESYLMLARRYQYHRLMNKLAQSQKVAVIEKQSNKSVAQLRAKLSMILANGGLYFNKRNERPKSRKANNRRNRFRNYHN